MNKNLCSTDLEIINFLKTVANSDFGCILTKVNVEKSGLRRALNRLVKREYIDYRRYGRKFLYCLKQDENKTIPSISNEKFNKASSMFAEIFYDMENTITKLNTKISILEKFTRGIEYKPLNQSEEKIREDEKQKIFTRISKATGTPISIISKIYDESE